MRFSRGMVIQQPCFQKLKPTIILIYNYERGKCDVYISQSFKESNCSYSCNIQCAQIKLKG